MSQGTVIHSQRLQEKDFTVATPEEFIRRFQGNKAINKVSYYHYYLNQYMALKYLVLNNAYQRQVKNNPQISSLLSLIIPIAHYLQDMFRFFVMTVFCTTDYTLQRKNQLIFSFQLLMYIIYSLTTFDIIGLAYFQELPLLRILALYRHRHIVFLFKLSQSLCHV